MNLFFLWGAKLSDPQGLLEGEGSQVRRIHIDDEAVIDEPPVRRLIGQAAAMASPPIDPTRPRRMVVKMALDRRRPRRPPAGRKTARRGTTSRGRP